MPEPGDRQVAGRLVERDGLRLHQTGLEDDQEAIGAQGIPLTSNEDMAKVLKALETLKPGDELKVTILRDDKVQELAMKWGSRP